MRSRSREAPGLMRMAAMRAIRVGFRALLHPVVVVCVHLPAALLVIQAAAILDFALSSGVKISDLVVAAPARAGHTAADEDCRDNPPVIVLPERGGAAYYKFGVPNVAHPDKPCVMEMQLPFLEWCHTLGGTVGSGYFSRWEKLGWRVPAVYARYGEKESEGKWFPGNGGGHWGGYFGYRGYPHQAGKYACYVGRLEKSALHHFVDIITGGSNLAAGSGAFRGAYVMNPNQHPSYYENLGMAHPYAATDWCAKGGYSVAARQVSAKFLNYKADFWCVQEQDQTHDLCAWLDSGGGGYSHDQNHERARLRHSSKRYDARKHECVDVCDPFVHENVVSDVQTYQGFGSGGPGLHSITVKTTVRVTTTYWRNGRCECKDDFYKLHEARSGTAGGFRKIGEDHPGENFVCTTRSGHAESKDCVRKGWGLREDDGRLYCKIPLVDADGGHLSECEISGIFPARTNPCADIFGAPLAFPWNEYRGEHYRANCQAGHIPDSEFIPPGVQQCVCNPATHHLDEDGACVAGASEVDCSVRHRVQTGTSTCGECRTGYSLANGVCRRSPSCAIRGRAEGVGPGLCRGCLSGYAEDEADENYCRLKKDCAAVGRNQDGPFACSEECRTGFVKNAGGQCQREVGFCHRFHRVKSGPLTCGGCVSGYTEDENGSCLPPDTGACGWKLRKTLDSGECGDCLDGFTDDLQVEDYLDDVYVETARRAIRRYGDRCLAKNKWDFLCRKRYLEAYGTSFIKGDPEICGAGAAERLERGRYIEPGEDGGCNYILLQNVFPGRSYIRAGAQCILARNCPKENREGGVRAAVCGACLPGHVEVGHVCNRILDCNSEQHREQTTDLVCGKCIEGFAEAEDGFCGPIVNFDRHPPRGELVAQIKGGREVLPGGMAAVGQTLAFIATPEPGYEIVAWTGACAGHGWRTGDRCHVSAVGGMTVGVIFAGCRNAGWTQASFLDGGGSCRIPVKDGTSEETWELCNFTGSEQGAPNCSDVFGDNFNFPLRANHAAGSAYVYNCLPGMEADDSGTGCVCLSGHSDIGDRCADIDECEEGLVTCGEGEVCVNSIGGAECACDGPGGLCDDYNIGSDCADYGWSAEVIDGVSTCMIPVRDAVTGEELDGCRQDDDDSGFSCKDMFIPRAPDKLLPSGFDHIEGIRYAFNCPAGSVQSGDFAGCVCPPGHAKNGEGVCADINECDANACGDGALCTNTVGSYMCACASGYARTGASALAPSCADINECKTGAHICASAANCKNTPGGHFCACESAGWTVTVSADGAESASACVIPVRDGTSDENWRLCNFSGTLEGAPDCSAVFGESADFPPQADHAEGDSYVYNCPNGKVPDADRTSCVCPSGYAEDDAGVCADIDECQAKACGSTAWCGNTPGSYECTCFSGYNQTGATPQDPQCEEIDECAAGTDNCAADGGVCTNIPGAFHCGCAQGYIGDGVTCHADKTVSFSPATPHGTLFAENEAGERIPAGDAVPHGTTVSFIIVPEDGYQLSLWAGDCSGGLFDNCAVSATRNISVGAVFGDADECAMLTQCESRIAYWTETWDIDDCTEVSHCESIGANCVNTPGAYYCTCPDGDYACGCRNAGWYVGIDPDGGASCRIPVRDGAGERSWTECNISGTDADAPDCSEVFEDPSNIPLAANHEPESSYVYNCPSGASPDSGRLNCVCLPGYADIGGRCADIDECEAGVDECPDNVACENTAGGHTCDCPFGHTFSGGECVCDRERSGVCRAVFEGVRANCINSGWPRTYGGKGGTNSFCHIPIRDASATINADREKCHMFNTAEGRAAGHIPCEDVFPDLMFPLSIHHNAGERYVYNCPGSRGRSADLKICDACPPGHREKADGTCEDIDECAANACGENALCTNTVGSYACACAAGYARTGLSAQAPSCADINECKLDARACPIGAACENTPGGRACVCPAGEGSLAGGACGVCPAGYFAINSVCEPAATKHTLPGRALTLYNLLAADNTHDTAIYANAVQEYLRGILDRHNGKADYLGGLADFEPGATNSRPSGGAGDRFFTHAETAGFGAVRGAGGTERALSQIPIRVSGAQECLDAGWGYSPAGESCGVPLTLSGGSAADQCHLSGGGAPQCADAFGTRLAFPPPTLSAAGATLRFVYDCDPDGESGLIPATINTVAATECACPAGQRWINGVCAACPAGHTLVGSWMQEQRCVSDADIALAAELQKTSPSLAAVRAALDAGANPDHVVGGSPALLAAARAEHAKIVSVLVTAGANVNATDSGGGRGVLTGWDVAHYAASRPGALGIPGSRAGRASVLYHFGAALDARNAMFADAAFDWNRDSSAVGGGFPASMLDRLAGAEEYARNFGASAGEDAGVINQMADYAFLRGARCVGTALTPSTHAHTRRICESTPRVHRLAARTAARAAAGAALLAEVEKPAGAANVATVRALLSGAAAADPNIKDSAGRPLLILAARNGHAEIVSVLAVAGADVNATDPTYSDYDAARHAAAPLTGPAAGPRALRASVLYYFGGGLDARNAAFGDADFDWTREDGGGRRLPDLLALAEDESPRSGRGGRGCDLSNGGLPACQGGELRRSDGGQDAAGLRGH